nr:alpha/beta hydrolase [Stutzerimonas kirkiae]
MKPMPSTLTAADGYTLGVTRYPASGTLRGRLIVAGATAVPQGFYRRFALYTSAQGFETLTLDYRGIGLSRPASLKGFRMNLLDWGRLDLAAAVEAMGGDDLPLYIVGHSYGGHGFGLLPNHQAVSGFYGFGVGAGWHGHMPLAERLKVLAMWRLVLPPLTYWKGYCPWKILGLGEDLPLDVYRQWRHWCGFPRYFFDDPAMHGIEEQFAAVRTPILAANALDDLWAMPRSRDAFLEGYSSAPITRLDLDPAQWGGQIGHMGYFRAAAEPLWQEVLKWFASLPPRPALP